MSFTGATESSPAPRAGQTAAQWLRREARGIRGPLVRTGLLTALLALALVGQAWVLSGILAAGVLAHGDFTTVGRLWLALLLLALLRFGLAVAARHSAFQGAQQLARRLRARILHGAQTLGPYGLRAEASGDLITRLVDGVEAILGYFARYLPQAGAAALVPALLVAFVFPADWLSGLILVATAPLIPLFMVLVGRAAAQASEHRHAQLRRLGAAFIDALGGLVTLRQLGAAERFAAHLEDQSEEYRMLTMQVLRVAFLSALVLEFFAMISIAIVAVLIGFRLLWGEMHLRAGLFVLLLAPEFYLPLRALGGLRHTRMDAVAAARQLAALDEHATGSAAPQPAGEPIGIAAAPQIYFEAVTYLHHGRAAGLRECSLVIPAGRVTALVGTTGCGKSTLLNLILGFARPGLGRVLIDGQDLATVDVAQWRESIAWVPQHTHVFEGTVRENLLLAEERADARTLERAAIESGLDAVLARLPKGWDTPLGERGLGLSGGELQRLALARALLRTRARVWLLDEPTAHLDAEGARSVETLICAAAPSRTVLLAVHRLSAARSADWVIVLRDGRVVEQGAPEELERSEGHSARLLQAEHA